MKEEVQTLKAEADALVKSELTAARAIDLYTKAICIDAGETAALFTNRALGHITLKKYDDAISDCHAALRIDPSWVRGYTRMSDAYRNQENMYRAVECLEKAQMIAPADENVALLREWKQWLKQKGMHAVTRPVFDAERLRGERSTSRLATLVLECGMNKHFKIVDATRSSEIPLTALGTSRLMPGASRISVIWRHPDEVTRREEGGCGQTPLFTLWDPASLALELHAMSTSYCCPERKAFLGGILYMACWRGEDHFFWSLLIMFIHTGYCFPTRDKIFPAGDATKMKSIYMTELKAQCKQMEQSVAAPGSTITMGSRLQAVTLHLQDMSSQRATMSTISKLTIPDYADTPEWLIQRPKWWLLMEELWGGQFRNFQSTGVPACLWVCKDACVAAEACELDHEGILRGVSAVVRGLAEPLKEQNKTEGQKLMKRTDDFPTLLSSKVTCSGCDTVMDVSERKDPDRCPVCGNTVYCSRACLASHQPAHAPHCRPPLGITKIEASMAAFETITHGWVIVLPGGNELKPYAKLIPASELESLRAVQKMLGVESDHLWGDIAGGHRPKLKQWQAMRGDNRMDLFIVSRVGNPSAPPNPRASAIVTDIEGPAAKGRGSMIDVEGPNVLIRGDAIAMRWGFNDGGPNRVRTCQKRGIRDFGWKDFDDKWGYFQMASSRSH